MVGEEVPFHTSEHESVGILSIICGRQACYIAVHGRQYKKHTHTQKRRKTLLNARQGTKMEGGRKRGTEMRRRERPANRKMRRGEPTLERNRRG